MGVNDIHRFRLGNVRKAGRIAPHLKNALGPDRQFDVPDADAGELVHHAAALRDHERLVTRLDERGRNVNGRAFRAAGLQLRHHLENGHRPSGHRLTFAVHPS